MCADNCDGQYRRDLCALVEGMGMGAHLVTDLDNKSHWAMEISDIAIPEAPITRYAVKRGVGVWW